MTHRSCSAGRKREAHRKSKDPPAQRSLTADQCWIAKTARDQNNHEGDRNGRPMLNAAPQSDRAPGPPTSPAEIPNPLKQLSLGQLGKRTSMKWRTHPSDALPLWVAEMDVQLAPSVSAALPQAIDIGDTGYPAGSDHGPRLDDLVGRLRRPLDEEGTQ